MRLIRSRGLVRSAVLVCALCAALAVASTAVASLPAGFTLQQQFTTGDFPMSPDFVDATHGWAVGFPNNLLYRTTDGTTWQVSTPASWTAVVYAVAFGTQTHGWAFADTGEIFATTDGGSTWAEQTSPVVGYSFNGACATDATHAWGYTHDGTIVGTSDGGANWSKQREVPGQRLYAGQFVDSTHGVVVGFQIGDPGSALVLTTTNGTTWTEQAEFAPGAELRSVWFNDGLNGWAAAPAIPADPPNPAVPSRVFTTTDGGVTWQPKASDVFPEGDDVWHSLVFVSPTHGFLGTSRNSGAVPTCLYETTNGGASWTGFAPNGAGAASIFGMAAAGTGNVWATGRTGQSAIWAWTGAPVVPGALSGVVTDSGGPLVGVSVSVPGTATVTTLSDGSYSVPGVTPGTYNVAYSKSGYTTKIVSVTILSDATATKDVTLVAVSKLRPVYRFYIKSNGSHFYTASEAEKNGVAANLSKTFSLEGVAYHVNIDYTTPLYRFYKRSNGSYFYTASEAEKNSVMKNLSSVYTYEGIGYYVSAAPTPTPVYRFYNRRNGTHFYTASSAEKASVEKNLAAVYSLDGIAFYAEP